MRCSAPAGPSWRAAAGGLVVVTGICERIWPAEPRPVLARGHADWLELRPAAHWPGALLVPLTIVAMDGANWLAHYADHKFDSLWRFHALHHSQEELSVLTSFRAHRSCIRRGSFWPPSRSWC